MKNIFESPEVFEAYARIDFRYLCLRKLYDGMATSQIDKMIDISTGKAEADKLATIELLEGLIVDKKFVGADVSREVEALDRVKSITK